MKRKYLLFAVPLLLSACGANEEFDNPSVTSDNVIEIGTYISKTRANVKETFVDGDEIVLSACRTTGDYSNTFTVNHMDRVKVTRTNGQWTYSPLVTWPTDENEHISFTAFYPYTTDATATKYKVTVTDEYARTQDPLWCTIRDAHIHDRNGKAVNGSEEDAGFEAASGAINLKFKHLLSKINVKVKLDESSSSTNCWLNTLSLNNVYNTGTFTYADDLSTGIWSLSGSKTYSMFTETGKTEEDKKISSIAKEIEALMLLPQNLVKDGRNVNFTMKYTYELAEGGTKEVEKTIYLPNEWEMNRSYNYTIVISLDTSTITVNADVINIDETEEYIPHYEAPETVDLSLPSGNLWAKYDYGSNDVMQQGPTYDYSSWSGFNCSFLGVNWTTPKKEDWDELITNCTIEMTEEGAVKYISKVDSNKYISFLIIPDSYYTPYSIGYWAYKTSGSYPSYYTFHVEEQKYHSIGSSSCRPIRLICKKPIN